MLKASVQKLLNSLGFDVIRFATNFSPEELEIMRKVKPHTATSQGRLVGMIDAVKYIAANRIEGAIVECGVWMGGSTMAALYALQSLGDTSREIYMYDTFEGMSAPTEKDVMFDGTPAKAVLIESERQDGAINYWCFMGVEAVRRNILATGYPEKRLHFVKGKVEDTLPTHLPGKIALLRLDTDWYESTKHELTHLYPLLAPNGVLIIDDYGHWQGAKQAVEEYFAGLKVRPFLSRLDYTGRLVIKPGT
ncbi:MAG: class I SAM-dependent methyltransferase [Verrucomicrobia bacterium]|nr:class I SAM-dependent methyltransferase [Verrucomicrobiota bacterium]